MQREKAHQRVAVIGAGITGLTTAWRLRRAGHTVVVVECSERPGGSIRTTRGDGWLVESGPNTMLLNDQAVQDFFGELGIADRLIEASPGAKNRFIVRDGRPVAAPMSLRQYFKTPLLSARAKWRLLAEPFIGRNRKGVPESVAQFARRRLGSEVVDYAINPLIGGIYAGSPDKLAIEHAFPTLFRFDRDHGSLVRGVLAARRARRASGQKRFKSRSISFQNGLQTIIDALVHEVGDSLFNRATLTSIVPGTPWRVRFTQPGEGETQIETDAVVVTVPGYAAATLPFDPAIRHPLAALDAIEYPPVTSLALGFRREQVAHPLDGYGVLVPACEGLHILGTLFSSSLFAGRAPDSRVLLTTFLGGMRQPELAAKPQAEIEAIVLGDLGRLLGVSGAPEFKHLTAWPRAIPQYNLGYAQFHHAMESAEKQCPGLFIGGHVRDGVSVGDCIRAGLKLAARVGEK